MTSLRKLTILNSSLHDLPVGPYLGGLHSLRLGKCVLLWRQLPEALAQATQLRHLDLASEVDLHTGNEKLLCGSPALESIRVSKPEHVRARPWAITVKSLQDRLKWLGRSTRVIELTSPIET